MMIRDKILIDIYKKSTDKYRICGMNSGQSEQIMMNENQNGSGVLKRFIRYLYEYEQGKRMRNVGFVKKMSVWFTYMERGCAWAAKKAL